MYSLVLRVQSRKLVEDLDLGIAGHFCRLAKTGAITLSTPDGSGDERYGDFRQSTSES